MSADIIARYVVRCFPPIPPAESYYVLDQAESPERTVAVCPSQTDAELVRGGLELLHMMERAAAAPETDVTGAPV